MAKEQLRLTEEEAHDVCHELDRSKETLREAETHIAALEYKLDICQAALREAQDLECPQASAQEWGSDRQTFCAPAVAVLLARSVGPGSNRS